MPVQFRMWKSCSLCLKLWYVYFPMTKDRDFGYSWLQFFLSKWRWLFHPPTPDGKWRFFRPPRASNGLMTKPFQLGGLQMILSKPPMSNSSGGTHMDHASKPKLRIWQKWVKNTHFFVKYELFIEKRHEFLFQKLNFLRIWVSHGKLLLRMKQP